MRVAIYGRKVSKQSIKPLRDVFDCLHSFQWAIFIEEDLAKSLEQKEKIAFSYETFNSFHDIQNGIDLVISMGGDGTFLRCVNYIKDSGVPILGINMGRLGFLANVSKEHIAESLKEIKEKNYVFQKRSMLRVEVAGSSEEDYFALNEIAIHKKDSSSMVAVSVHLDNNYLNTYWSDGLIVSTPTGSTAYNLSCGGPIITPGCQVHIITPIAAHNLNVRPVVVPDHMPITMRVEGGGRTYLMSIDGKSRSIKQGQEITIRKADFMINVIKFENNNFLDTIRNKMLWGIDKRN